MSGYAPNPGSEAEAPASLTSGLLARKGQATPAVDTVAHEGVDMDMSAGEPAPRASSRPTAGPSRPRVGQKVVETLTPKVSSYRARMRVGAARAASRPAKTIDQPPENWTTVGEAAPLAKHSARPRLPAPQRLKAASAAPGVRATVTFRMPVDDFVRLHYAARDLEETCQTIILDALSAYFDANDIAQAPEEGAAEEAARLLREKKSRRG